jgi:hypothetical protein
MDLIGHTRQDYLDMVRDWEDPMPPPRIVTYNVNGKDVHVVRDDELEIGTKARFGDYLVRTMKEDTLVYVQPRQGYAGLSLAYLCNKYNKKLVLFVPACQEISQHQAACYHRGAELKFHRIAAMPVLNQVAKKWAGENGAAFVPLGLKHPLVTACGVKVAYDLANNAGYAPRRCWSAISTGVLARALGIAWPECQFQLVAVARNVHAGEAGNAVIHSSGYEFSRPTKYPPPWPSVGTYDAKVHDYLYHFAENNDWIWNVARDIPEQVIPQLDSHREWNEHRY